MHIITRRFLDYEFPPAASSLQGDPPPLRPVNAKGPRAESARWASGMTLAQVKVNGPLFDASSEPQASASTAQGFIGLGDVWPEDVTITRSLLAAVREYPGHLEMLFAPGHDVDPQGFYSLRLYDMWQRRWRRFKVDDFLPVVDGPQGPEPWPGGHFNPLWVAILEKGLAKLCGSFEALRRSYPGPVLMALTGELQSAHWKRDGGWWSAWQHLIPDVDAGRSKQHPDDAPTTHRRVTKVRPLRCKLQRVGGSWHQNIEFFSVLKELHGANSLLLAWASAGSETMTGELPLPRPDPRDNGLVQGHGYSLLGFVNSEEGGGIQLVQLRNVWGTSMQWTGAWSAGSSEWEEFPEVRRHHLRPEHQAAGRFWMSWSSFCELFDHVEVCPMASSARKASYALRTIRGRSANRSRTASGGYFPSIFRLGDCCSVERADE